MVGKLKYIPPQELFVLHSNTRLPSIATSPKSMFVRLLSLLVAALSGLRTSSIDSELDYYMAATKGTLFFPDNARLFFSSPHLRTIPLQCLLFHINFSL